MIHSNHSRFSYIIAVDNVIYVHRAVHRVEQPLQALLCQTAGGDLLLHTIIFESFAQLAYQLAQQQLILRQSLNRLHQKTVHAELIAYFVLNIFEERSMQFTQLLWLLAIYRVQNVNIKSVSLKKGMPNDQKWLTHTGAITRTSMKSMKVWQIFTMHMLHCFSAG